MLGDVLARTILASLALSLGVFAASARALDVRVVNHSDRPDDRVYVMLHGGSSADGKLVNDEPRRLSAISGHRFALSSLPGGRIFFSYGRPVTAAEPPSSDTRYDKVELTVPGVANLTAVDFFAIPFRLETLNAAEKRLGGLAYKVGANTIRRALMDVAAPGALVRTREGAFARVLSPQLSPESYPSFYRDVRSMAGKRVTLRGAFYGTPYQEFTYSGRFADNGSIRLNGTLTTPGGATTPGKTVAVTGSSLPSAIYTVNGPFTVGGQPATVSDNNVYSVIYRDLLSGFAWGYMGGRYGSDSENWWGKPPFQAARATEEPYATFNEYAAAIYRYSDAYGFSFSDTGPKPVLLPLDHAATLRITILGDR
jgi:hypothetical protein